MTEKGIYCGYPVDEDGRVDPKPVYYSKPRMGVVIGPTGSRKSMGHIVANGLIGGLDDESLVFIDPKCQLFPIMGESLHRRGYEVVLIDEYGMAKEQAEADPDAYRYLTEHGLTESRAFNPMRSVNDGDPLCYDHAAANADACHPVEGNDPHWAESAQSLSIGLQMLEAKLKGGAASFAEVRRMATEFEKIERVGNREEPTSGIRYNAMLAVATGDETMESLAGRFTRETKEVLSIVSCFDTQTRWMLSKPINAGLRKPGFDFRDLKKKKIALFIVLPAQYLRTQRIWLRLLITNLLGALYTPKGRPVTIFLDEMPIMGYLEAVAHAYGYIRDFNVRIIGYAQDINQLKRMYKDDSWQTFIGNCGFVLSFAPNDMNTAKWMSDFSGQATIITKSKSKSTNKGTTKGTNKGKTTGTNKGKTAGKNKSWGKGDSHLNMSWFFRPADNISKNEGGGDSTSDTEGSSEGKTEGESFGQTEGEQEGLNENETGRALWLPHNLRGLPEGHAMLMLAGLSYPLIVKLPLYTQIEPCASRAGVNPYYNGRR